MPSVTNPEIITKQSRLEAVCDTLRKAGRFAFDTEFIRDDTFDAALCLVQVTDGSATTLIDPVADVDLSCFWELVADPDIVAVVHAGKEDFEICLRASGCVPRNVFDVQIAAGFVGYGYPLSLSRLVDAVRRRRIAKGQTMTDWLRRPLTQEQIRYAAEDVAHLPAIFERLNAKLEKADRVGWAREEFAKFEDPEFYAPPPDDRAFRVKGAKKLDSLSLLVLSKLVAWRDEWAQQKNRPPRALMRDDVLVDVARRQPKEASQLEVMRGFPQARNRAIVNEILSLIAEAQKTPKSQWPEPYEAFEETPMVKAARDLLSAVARAICHEEGVSQDLVGGAQKLRELMAFALGESDKRPALLTGWREQFIGGKLLEVLEGGGDVHLSGWPNAIRLEVTALAQKAKSE